MTREKPFVLALSGVPGAGKTSIAEWIRTNSSNTVIVSRDAIRSKMFPLCTYSSEERNAAFEAVCLSTPICVNLGQSVIIDGTCFSAHKDLLRMRQLTAEVGAMFFHFHCDCPLDVAIARVEKDRLDGTHVAADRDGNLVRMVFERFKGQSLDDVHTIDSTQDPEMSGSAIIQHIKNSSH